MLCVLHCDMRLCERCCEDIEKPLRDRLKSGASAAALAAIETFNTTMKEKLHLRHNIAKDSEGTKIYPASLDGRDAGRLRGDWERLGRVVNADGCGSSAGEGRLEHYKEQGQYPSTYFRALHEAMKACGGMEVHIEALPARAEAICDYARAMRLARMPPEAMREYPGGPEAVHDEFEVLSRRFSAAWRLEGFQFKGYGYHLWTNMPHLFRRWGCLELASQQGMEGVVGKLSTLLPKIAWHARGRFKEGMSPQEEEHELQKRRAELAPPAQKVVEEFRMEAMASTTEHLPSRKHDTRWSLKEILLKIDELIEAEKVLPYAGYTGYWKRYIYYVRWAIKFVSRLRYKLAPRYYEALLKEHLQYYDPTGVQPALLDSKRFSSVTQKARKTRYHLRARATWAGGMVSGGRMLVYQAHRRQQGLGLVGLEQKMDGQ